MKCLSLWQPWASLMAIGAKQIETRAWKTNHHGLVAIHAAKTIKELGLTGDPIFLSALQKGGIHGAEGLPLGAVVAVGRLTDCRPVEQLGELTDEEREFGNYAAGRFGWRFSHMRRLAVPFPLRGQQGLFDIDDSVASGWALL